MKKSIIMKIIVCVFVIICSWFIGTKESKAYTNHTYQEAFNWYVNLAQSHWWGDVDGDSGCQCVDLIMAYYDYLVGYHVSGDAQAYSWNELPAGWIRVDSNPRPGDVVVWKPNAAFGWNETRNSHWKHGHIGIVYAVPGADHVDYGSIWTVETNAVPGRSETVILTEGGYAEGYARSPANVACYIRPDFYDITPIPDIHGEPVDLGDNFYAYLTMAENGLYNADRSSDIVLENYSSDLNLIWKFVKQSDGSYTIMNAASNLYMDICGYNDYDGGIIWTYPYNGSTAQKYFVYPSKNGYVLRPQCSINRVVTVNQGGNVVGRKLNVWFYYKDCLTQVFKINKTDLPKTDNNSMKNETTKKNTNQNTNNTNKNNNTNTNTKNNTNNQSNTGLPFKDIKKSDWYFNAVKYTYSKGIISGYSKTEFAPNDMLTRGMIVTILYRMEGSPNNDGKSEFSDVETNAWYSKAIKWAVRNEIVHGYGGTNNFGPKDNILRQDLAGILRNYANYKNKNVKVSSDLSKFSDSKNISGYAKASMKWAVGKGVITGNKNGTLNPKGNATRAEAAAMIQKYCEKVGK